LLTILFSGSQPKQVDCSAQKQGRAELKILLRIPQQTGGQTMESLIFLGINHIPHARRGHAAAIDKTAHQENRRSPGIVPKKRGKSMHIRKPLIAAALLMASHGAWSATLIDRDAHNGPPPKPAPGPTLQQALDGAYTALAACKALGHGVTVAVVDSAGVVKLHIAADGAHPGGVSSALRKAQTAVDFAMPTGTLREKIKSDQALIDKYMSNPVYILFPGGFPIMAGGKPMGAIAVGGGENIDAICAQKGLEKIEADMAQ
jgi:uncharacterized protein GlcG (DUF336 family)